MTKIMGKYYYYISIIDVSDDNYYLSWFQKGKGVILRENDLISSKSLIIAHMCTVPSDLVFRFSNICMGLVVHLFE